LFESFSKLLKSICLQIKLLNNEVITRKPRYNAIIDLYTIGFTFAVKKFSSDIEC